MPEAPDFNGLRSIPLFSELTEDEVYRVAKLTFVKPYRKGELIPAIESVLARAHEDRVIDEEIESAGPSNAAEDKLETRRLVEQAKSILMDRDGLDEDAAFTLIQQRAMQTRTRMRDVAQSVVQGDAPER